MGMLLLLTWVMPILIPLAQQHLQRNASAALAQSMDLLNLVSSWLCSAHEHVYTLPRRGTLWFL